MIAIDALNLIRCRNDRFFARAAVASSSQGPAFSIFFCKTPPFGRHSAPLHLVDISALTRAPSVPAARGILKWHSGTRRRSRDRCAHSGSPDDHEKEQDMISNSTRPMTAFRFGTGVCALLGTAALSLLCRAASADIVNFSMTLDGSQETPAVDTPATGSGTATLNTATNQFSWNISFSGLSAGQTAAHFRRVRRADPTECRRRDNSRAPTRCPPSTGWASPTNSRGSRS